MLDYGYSKRPSYEQQEEHRRLKKHRLTCQKNRSKRKRKKKK